MKTYFKGIFCLVVFIHFSFNTDFVQSGNEVVTINASKELGLVSPHIMGFNIVYSAESDEAWQSGSGKVAGMIKSLGTGQLRYPGGTVVTKYHWENPTGQGWADSWAPDFDASKNAKPSSFMDLDEYLEVTKKQKIEPLVGINMGSGIKYNRVQEGVDEAIRLMKHCIAKGVKVKYYYLDNEPYQPDANFTYTAEQYADMINIYVPAMKKIDPDIKIIANTQARTDIYIKPLLERAGKNIDLIDVHNYWKHKTASFDNWKAEPQMTHQNRGTYAEHTKIWEKVFADAGFPNIRLVILEWNIGPPGELTTPTDAEAALMVSEQFTQYIQSGLFMSCFWPLSWPGTTNWASRILLKSKENYQPNKMYDMFALYTDVLDQQKVSSTATNQRLINLAVKSKDGKTLWVYLINKDQQKEALNVDVSVGDFKAATFSAVAFDAQDVQSGRLAISDAKVNKNNSSGYHASMPKNSFLKITFKK